MKKVISEIKDETNWDFARDFSAVTISVGDAPEDGSLFGIRRSATELIFGSWISELSPNYYRNNLYEFLIIRESFALFFTDEILFQENFDIVSYIINILAFSYLKRIYKKKSFELKYNNVRSHLIVIKETTPESHQSFIKKVDSLLTIVLTQNLSIRLVFDTFTHFLDDFVFGEIDQDEILDYLLRYLSNKPEEVVAPIRLRPITLEILSHIVDQGFGVSSLTLADEMNIDNTLITRELNKITNRYNAKFRVEKNSYKLGLHYHSIIVRFKSENKKHLEKIFNDLCKIDYIGEIYEGVGEDDTSYLYSITLCPFIVADGLSNRLEKYFKNNFLDSFEVKPLKNRIFMTALTEKSFKPSLENYQGLLDGSLPCIKIETWNNNTFSDDVPYNFTKDERDLLRFLSIYQSHSLANPQSYRLFMEPLNELLTDNNISMNSMDEFLSFMNRYRNLLIEKDLIGFRLQLTSSSMPLSNMLILKINCNPNDDDIKELLNKLAIFSWTGFNVALDSIIMRVLGIDTQNPITKLLVDEISNYGLTVEKWTSKSKLWRYIPYSDLYYYDDKKWMLK
ncbi:MAG: hypothetical protein FK734_05425 [Asgard group archaeon]|nr:hypothetical protein [Asgard group archaeon]